MPYVSIKDDLAAGRMETVLDDFVTNPPGVYVVYPHRRHLSAKIRSFVDFLVKWFEKHGDCG